MSGCEMRERERLAASFRSSSLQMVLIRKTQELNPTPPFPSLSLSKKKTKKLDQDWGTQFGMLIQHIAESRDGGLDAATDEDVSDLQALYKASKKRFDLEEDFKVRARAAVTKLQGGDAQSRAAWARICEASRREFEAIYQRLGVSIQERGESYYNPMLPGIVRDLQAAGVAVEDNGAQVVWCEGIEHPLMVQKSDGERNDDF